ncbi:MAG: hypothetical protein MSH40_00885 [Christensenella sp.]|nr:hypothetical protein [Christensenella sp.]
MKKRIVFILFVAIIMCFSLFAVSCKKNDNIEEEKNTFILVEEKGEEVIEKVIDLSNIDLKNGLITVLDNQEIEYVIDSNEFTKFDQMEMYIEGDDIYIIEVYTSNETDQDDSEYARTVTYKGVELVNIKCSPYEMNIANGTIVLVKLEKI